MADETCFATQRTPEEVWWIILDEVIDVPLLIGSTYEGNDWSNAGCKSIKELDDLYETSETQRKTIGSVCRLWQAFAQSRRYRALKMHDKDRTLERIQKARLIYFSTVDIINIVNSPLAQGKRVEWEHLRTNDLRILHRVLSVFSCPRLRRLELAISEEDDLFFVDLLPPLPEITWIDYNVFYDDGKASVVQKKPSITLPNLQVFRGRCHGSFSFPLSSFLVPSLRHLYITVSYDIPIEEVPLLDILLPCRRSIESVVVELITDTEDFQTIKFPPWADFPNLKELELDERWCIQFEPLSSNHPLQKFDAQPESFDPLPSFMDGINMRRITLEYAFWTGSGELQGRVDTMKIDARRAAELFEKAKERGITFEVYWYEDDIDDNYAHRLRKKGERDAIGILLP
ncbi:hypothetical protein CPB86DRAFT_784870 [Serendipita vermifera]|nr:hypothetical protein CPB86DRAFT_784870 [Serendipita vermifera]